MGRDERKEPEKGKTAQTAPAMRGSSWSGGLFIEDLTVRDMLFGYILRAPADKGVIVSLGLPIMPHPFFALGPGDISGKNRVSLFFRSMPLIAEHEVAYRGQPLALFCGPDYRQLEHYAQKTTVLIDRKQQEQELEDRGVPLTMDPLVTEQGDQVIAETETFQVMEAGYSVWPPPRSMAETMGALAYRDGDTLVVITATSWLAHVRETVAAATACLRKSDRPYPRDSRGRRPWNLESIHERCVRIHPRLEKRKTRQTSLQLP
jgi:CO/xanthine dehydrogenase Mo-binding subunit